MTQIMTLWITTVSLLLLVLTLRLIEHFRTSTQKTIIPHHTIEIEKEANLIYCPGDIADAEDSDDL